MASRSAVRPLGEVSIRRLCKSSTLLVNELVSSARSLKLTRKNSSCGLAVLRKSTAASRALPILLLMLPLQSKITPIEMGTSSEEKVTISCSTLSSKTRKLSGSRPLTKRSLGSVTTTFTRARSTSMCSPCEGLKGIPKVFFFTSSGSDFRSPLSADAPDCWAADKAAECGKARERKMGVAARKNERATDGTSRFTVSPDSRRSYRNYRALYGTREMTGCTTSRLFLSTVHGNCQNKQPGTSDLG